MNQNGGLVNPPINTPAPGTGAIDARVSPDGTLVAYWFVTTVNDGLCAFCVDVASRVLISHVDRFTAPTEVGTPNTGSMPSWMSNNTLLLSNGNATQWYYTLGMPEAAEWWGDTDNCGGCANPVGLTDGEVSRDGQRIALVRGDNHESIWLYRTTGPPPSIPTAECALTGAVGGAFASPTWSANGQILAWQEGNGVWSADVPDITNCQSITPSQLIIPGGSDPTFSPANLDPGARPPCDNPGNPTTCPPSPVTPSPATPSPAIVRGRLATLLSAYARTLRRLRIGGLRRQRHIAVAFTAPS